MKKGFLEKLFTEEIKLVSEGKCPMCEKKVDRSLLINDLDIRENEISGLCKYCIDQIFTSDEEYIDIQDIKLN